MRTLLKGTLAMTAMALAGTAATAQGDNPRNDGMKVVASLTADAEVPGPGDSDAAGLFEALINPETERICYSITAGNIAKATSAVIRSGGPSETGEAVLTLDTPDGDDDDSEDCQDIDVGLASAIVRDPAGYYVQIHTLDHPEGALRGQLTGLGG